MFTSKKMKVDLSCTTYTKINSKCITGLKVKLETIKLHRRKREYLQDLGLGKGFLDWTPKPHITIVKNDKLDFIKIKNFCSAKDSGKCMKSKLHARRKYSQIINSTKV